MHDTSRRHMWVVFKFKLQVKAGVNADIGYGFKSGYKQTVKKKSDAVSKVEIGNSTCTVKPA